MHTSNDNNPFRVPQLDSRLLELRKEENDRKITVRESRSLIENRIAKPKAKGKGVCVYVPKKNAIYDESDILSRHHAEKKTSVSELISKQREMLLLNMTINTQKEEIEKIDLQLKTKADEIKAKEESLEESAASFDSLLKENDTKAHEADRLAEKEAKKRHEKMQDVKRLSQQLQAVRYDIAKHTVAIEEFSKCKQFLDQLTPNSWFADFAEEKKSRQRSRRKARIEKRNEEFRRHQEALKMEAIAKDEKERGSSRKSRRQRRSVKECAESLETHDCVVPEPDFEDESLESSGDECPMWFEKPQQLLDAFTALEYENSFIIAQVHSLESVLKELNIQIDTLKEGYKHENIELADESHPQISLENAKASPLREQINLASQSQGNSLGHLLYMLQAKVKEVHDACGLGDNGSSNLLVTLSDIKAVTDSLLSKIEIIPTNFVMDKMNTYREARRQRLAEERKIEEGKACDSM